MKVPESTKIALQVNSSKRQELEKRIRDLSNQLKEELAELEEPLLKLSPIKVGDCIFFEEYEYFITDISIVLFDYGYDFSYGLRSTEEDGFYKFFGVQLTQISRFPPF
jgi:hypothetical protein